MEKAYWLIIGILLVLTTGCQNNMVASSFQGIPNPPETKNITCDLPPFDSVILGNNVKADLVNGKYGMGIVGVQKYYQCPRDLTDRILRVSNSFNPADQILVKISAPNLKKLTVTDNAEVNAPNFDSKNLTVIAKKYGTINLVGDLNLNKIYQFGHNRINIDGITSDDLLIKSYNDGPISLAGEVAKTVVKLTNHAKLYARYLWAQQAYVFTTDHALAEILALDTLGAFATDHSNIHYYQKPLNLTVVTKDAANALHLPPL